MLVSLDLDGGHGCARNRRQQRATHRVPEGVPEPRLEWFDDEPRTVFGDHFLRQSRTLCDEHFLPSRVTHYLMTRIPRPEPLRPRGPENRAGLASWMPASPVASTTWSRARRSSAPVRRSRSDRGPGAGGRGSASGWGGPQATPGRSAPRGSHAPPPAGGGSSTSRRRR